MSDKADQLTRSVSGPYIASILEQKLGYAVDAGDPYYVPGCTSSSDCVFPNAVIPQSAWSVPAQHLLQYIPAPNSAAGFSTSSYVETLNDNKGAAHVDWHTGLGIISGYYFKDNYYLVNPYPVTQGGASVPGFAAATTGGAQLFALSDTKTFGATLVNDLHASEGLREPGDNLWSSCMTTNFRRLPFHVETRLYQDDRCAGCRSRASPRIRPCR